MPEAPCDKERRVSLLIRDVTIITVDAAQRVISDGAVLIEGRHIADIGPAREVLSRHAPPARIKKVIPRSKHHEHFIRCRRSIRSCCL